MWRILCSCACNGRFNGIVCQITSPILHVRRRLGILGDVSLLLSLTWLADRGTLRIRRAVRTRTDTRSFLLLHQIYHLTILFQLKLVIIMKLSIAFACTTTVSAFTPSAFTPKSSVAVKSTSSLQMALKEGESKFFLWQDLSRRLFEFFLAFPYAEVNDVTQGIITLLRWMNVYSEKLRQIQNWRL